MQQPPPQLQQQHAQPDQRPREPPQEVKVDGPPARVVTPHLSRPAVSRGVLHHLAKAFGIHLKGDVATNEISTAKYTLLTFLPVNLFEQFLRVANMYFLLMVILQLIPGLSPTSLFTTVAPLVFVLAVNAIKEGYDDVQRHRCALLGTRHQAAELQLPAMIALPNQKASFDLLAVQHSMPQHGDTHRVPA